MSQVLRWSAPSLEPVVELPPEPVAVEPEIPVPRPPTLEEIQAIQDEARKEGYDAGFAHGQAQGQGEIRRLTAQIEGILDNFSRPLARLESEVLSALGELSVRIAGNLIGRAYQAEPELLAELVAEAVGTVGVSTREVEVRLHPDDITALAPVMQPAPGTRLVPDLSLARGDLRVHAETVRIDGTLEARLRGALEAVITKAGGAA